jgi:hypothetical protein
MSAEAADAEARRAKAQRGQSLAVYGGVTP